MGSNERGNAASLGHVLVTGAGSGIGRAIACRLAGPGVSLSLVGRSMAALEETVRTVQASGSRAGAWCCDVREREQVDAAVAAAAAAHGPLRAAVANSGIGGPNEDGPEDRFEDLVATNLTGAYWTLRAAQRHLESGPAPRHLLAVSSILGRIGVPGYTGYCASKTGLLGLVRALAMELAPRGVQVNAICPGWVDTAMARAGMEDIARVRGVSYETARRDALASVPMGKMNSPEEIAGVVAWLFSPDSAGITGQGIDVNGGAWM